MNCFRKYYHGISGEDYEKGSEIGIGFDFAGIPKWVWEYVIFKISFFDGIASI